MSARPYPSDRWPKLAAAQVRALNAWLRSFQSAELAAAQACARVLLGVAPQLTLLPTQTGGAAELLGRVREPVVGLLLEHASGRPEHSLLLVCPPDGAAVLADRTLGGDGSLSFASAGQQLDDLSQGALAYLVARLLAESRTGWMLRCLLTSSAELTSALGGSQLLMLPATLGLGAQLCPLRLFCRLDLAEVPFAFARRHQQRPWLEALPLVACAELGTAVLSAAELQTLGQGDVILLDGCELCRSDEGWSGQLTLRVAGSSYRRRCRASHTTLVLETQGLPHEPTEEARMTSGRRDETAAPTPTPSAAHHPSVLAGDAPIELRVELARFSLSLGELAQLGPGQVLSTGRRIGESVSVRAADRAIAEAELVDVDGEVGVRILRLLGA